MRRELLIASALAILTLGVYWPVGTHEFILFDDPEFIAHNPHVRAGLTWETVKYAFTASVAGNWHPVTTLSHALDCQVFGVDSGAHHLANAAFHTANALLLFFLLQSMSGATWRSAIVAGLFALHPLRVESVAWIAERKDVLSGFFFMLTLLAYTKYARAKSRKAGIQRNNHPQHAPRRIALWYALSLCLFALGLMSKPMLVTVPFVLFLLDYWPLHRFELSTLHSALCSFGRLFLEKIPFLVLSVVACAITLRIQEVSHMVRTSSEIGLITRLGTAIVSYFHYLAKTFWPNDLAMLYPHPGLHYPVRYEWPVWEVVTIALLLLAISALCICQIRRRPWLAFGWCWYLGTLVPVIGLIQVGEQAFADRYTYLPLIGPVLVLVWGVAEWWRTWASRKVLLAVPVFASTAACILLTSGQLHYWQNTVTLLEHTAAVTPDNPAVQYCLGCGLWFGGHPQQAAARFRAALAIEPRMAQAHCALGGLLKDGEHWQAAAEQFQATIRWGTNAYPAHLGLAMVLPHLGRNRQAIPHMDEVLRLQPKPPIDLLNDFAWSLATSEQAEARDGAAAVRFAEKACELTENRLPVTIGTLAAAYAEAGRFQDAVAAAERAIALAATSNQNELVEKNRQLLEWYRTEKAYHEVNQKPRQ